MSDSPRSWRPSRYLTASAILHLSAAAAMTTSPAHWPWILVALGLNHGGLALGGLLPRSRLLGPNLRRVPASHLGPNEVVLTFDDGPDPEVTPRVVDLLGQARMSASFFLIGREAERFGEIAKETARRGNGVENHSYGHSKAFAFYGAGRLGREIDRAQDVLASVSGRMPQFFRAPAGIRNVCLDPVLHRRGLSLVSWTRRGFDTVERRPEVVARRLVRRLAPGDLLLLHDGSSCRDRRGEPVVLEALKRVLETLDQGGLRAVALPHA